MRTSAVATPYRFPALTNTVVNVGTVGAAGKLSSFRLYNPGNKTAYVQLFNAQASLVTLGTTVPFVEIPVLAGEVVEGSGDELPMRFPIAISVAATESAGDNDAPSATGDGATLHAMLWRQS